MTAPASPLTTKSETCHQTGPRPDQGGSVAMKSILVVDDDPSIRFSLRKVLSAEGYETFLAADAEEAIELFGKQPVHLVLLDLNLPTKSGWDIFGTLTSQDPCLPIIIITGRHDQIMLTQASGISALMEKPLNVPLLLLTVAELLEEPPEARLKRLVGHRQDFVYVAPIGNAGHKASTPMPARRSSAYRHTDPSI